MTTREDRNTAFHAAFGEPWEGAGEAHLKSTAERGVPFVNMQMLPRHGTTGKTVHKSAAELTEATGHSHVTGSGLATGRVSRRLREQMAGGDYVVRPSMRAQMLADSDDTARTHDTEAGLTTLHHPRTIEDAEVAHAGLPPLRATSSAGFMPGLGSVAMHRQEARAHEAHVSSLMEHQGAMAAEQQRAVRRQKAALGRGDTAAAKEHGATAKELGKQITAHQRDVVAPVQKMADWHNNEAGKVAARKMEALRFVKANSNLVPKEGQGWTAAAMEAHQSYFDPSTKEEFYPLASQHQLGDMAQEAAYTHVQATNMTGMSSAQRRWRNEDEETGEVSHPNLEVAGEFGRHFHRVQSSGELDEVESRVRSQGIEGVNAQRTKVAAMLDQHHPLSTGLPRKPQLVKSDAEFEKHVEQEKANHVTSTFQREQGGMGLPDAHGRYMARMLMADDPRGMSKVWEETDSDKRPTFTLGMAARHALKSVRRQSVQAMTVDTHRAKETGTVYDEILGTGPGMHVSAGGAIPHQPGRGVQPAYNVLAMTGSRAALRMTAQRFKEGGEAITPRYAQENPWGLFAAQNMADIVAARRAKAEGDIGRVRRTHATGYYDEQKSENSRLRNFHGEDF